MQAGGAFGCCQKRVVKPDVQPGRPVLPANSPQGRSVGRYKTPVTQSLCCGWAELVRRPLAAFVGVLLAGALATAVKHSPPGPAPDEGLSRRKFHLGSQIRRPT